MCESKERQDPLQEAAFEALTAADRLAEAIAAVEAAQALTPKQIDQLRGLRPASLAPSQITRSAIEALQELAGCLEPAIRGETQTWFVHDEHDTSGGHEESTTSDMGFALICLRSASLNLAKRLAALRNLREAERVAEQLRA